MNDYQPLNPAKPVSVGHGDSAPRECIHQLFEDQSSKTPDAIALSCGDVQLSYEELNQRANQLAHHLSKLGIAPEIPVALCLERSCEMIVAILAVLKAGGHYVPLDLAYPKERLAFMLADTQASVLLTQQSLLASLPEHSARTICLDTDWEKISGEPTENLAAKANGEDVAYVIFTSGSTGQPKGVLVTHHNVVRLFAQTNHWYRFNSGDVWTLFHSYAFDFSVWEIWGALLYGGRLVVVPYLMSRSPDDFYELLARERVTVLNQTPSAFRQLIRAEISAQTKRGLNLRYVIFGGEALELQSLKSWIELHGDEKPLLVNMYGITETTVHVTYRPIKQIDLSNGIGSVIGVPIPDLQIHLLDENLQPVAPNVPGEMFIGGAGVARGYLNRPELTAQRFIPDPFSKIPGTRLYRSGDMARCNSHGELEYLGRIDHQVKIRGFRIELGEIENALRQFDGVQQAVVMARDETSGNKRLVAYLRMEGAPLPPVPRMREFLQTRLPDYMIPAAYVLQENFPLTPNGKIDRAALPEPASEDRSLNETYVAPETPLENDIAAIWSEVFRINRVGMADNFFALGGHSLTALQILVRIREKTGVELPVRTIFETASLRHLVEALLEKLLADEDNDELGAVLKNLNEMSDEEANKLLRSDLLNGSIPKIQRSVPAAVRGRNTK